MKIKIIALLAAIALTASTFAACGSSGTSSSTPSDTGNSSGEAEKPREEVQLLWYQWGDPPTDSDVVYEKLNEMSKEKLNTTVDFKFANNDKAKLIVSTGEKYDLIFTCAWQNDYIAQASKGVFADLTDILPTVAPDLHKFIPENCWNAMRIKGKINGVPTYKDSAACNMWNMPKSIIERADLQAEWDALGTDINSAYPLLEKLQKYINENGPLPETNTTNALMIASGGWLPVYAFDTLNNAGGGIGVPYSDTSGKVINKLQFSETVDAIKFMKKCWDNGIINKDAPTNEVPAESVFGVGQGWPGCEPFWKSTNYGDKVVAVKDSPMYSTWSVQGSAQAISVSSPNVERALEYLEYCNLDKDYRNIFSFGIQDEHWKMLPEGNIEKTDKGRAGYTPGAFSQATFFTQYNEAPTPAGSWDILKETSDSAPATILNGFVWIPEAVETETTTLNSIWEKHSKKYVFGKIDDVDAEIAKTIKEFENGGLAKVLADAQAQVDEFLATKK